MSGLRICLTRATNPVDVKWNASLGFGYLKAYAERLLPGALSFRAAETLEEALAGHPEVLGISSTSQDFGEAVRMCDQARAAGVPVVVLGGFHITAFPETLPPSADLGVLGEGEVTFGQVLALLIEKGGLRGGALAEIPGLVYWDDAGDLQRSAPRPVVERLDDLPVPDHHFGLAPGRQPYLFTSRGCPYHCSFCASSVYWPNVRFHGAERVISEIEGLLRLQPDLQAVSFWDDLFTADRKRLGRIADLFEEKGLHKRLRMVSSVRANLITDELCQTLKRLRYTHVGFGAESGSDAILKKLKDPRYRAADNQRALDTAQRHGFQGTCGFVLGHYDETEADVHATYGFILDNYASGKLAKHDITILTPMPGTPLWQWAEQHGFVRREGMEWHRLRYLAMYSNNLRGIEEWMALREQNGSLYLNDRNVPRGTLYQLIRHYEDKVARGDWSRPPPPRVAEPVPDYFLRRRQEIVAAVPAGAKSILDVGCGGGALGQALREQDPTRKLVGIESHPGAARHARRCYDAVFAVDAESFDPPFLPGEFDCLVLADVLEHLRDPWGLLRRLLPALRPGGTVVASVPNVRRISVLQPLAEAGRWDYQEEGVLDRTHLRFFTRQTFARLLEEAGVLGGTVLHLGGEEYRSCAPDEGGNLRIGRLTLEQVSEEEFADLCALQFLFVGTFSGRVPEAGATPPAEVWRAVRPEELPEPGTEPPMAEPLAFRAGFHRDEGGFRWMSRTGAIRVRRDATPALLRFQVRSAAPGQYRAFPFQLRLSVQGASAWQGAATVGGEPVEIEVPIAAAASDVTVRLESAQSFVPAHAGGSDHRELSVVLSRVGLAEAAPGAPGRSP